LLWAWRVGLAAVLTMLVVVPTLAPFSDAFTDLVLWLVASIVGRDRIGALRDEDTGDEVRRPYDLSADQRRLSAALHQEVRATLLRADSSRSHAPVGRLDFSFATALTDT
jgi:hypothetical protein